MTGPAERLPGRLASLAGVLGEAAAQWAARDDSKPQPEVREAANTAMDAIDAMLRILHEARAQLVAEVRESDDAAAARADALLARLRDQRQDGPR